MTGPADITGAADPTGPDPYPDDTAGIDPADAAGPGPGDGNEAADTERRARAYVAAVRTALADLPPEQRDALTGDLAAHLAEPDDTGTPLLDLQPAPERYAAELRALVPDAGPTPPADRSTGRLRRNWSRPAWARPAAVVVAALVLGGAALAVHRSSAVSAPAPSSGTAPAQATAVPSATGTVVVPDLVGLPLPQARALLDQVGLPVVVRFAAGSGTASGTVVAADPAAQTRVPPGTAVQLLISQP